LPFAGFGWSPEKGILSALVQWEGNDLADVPGASEQHEDPVESRRDAALTMWRRWSWSAAACSLTLATVSLFFIPSSTPSTGEGLIPTPELEVPDLFSS
jgi:hypothetical protein